ncbi:hypothetical protein ACTA71_002277 [Dictyostelium dimigraforme]
MSVSNQNDTLEFINKPLNNLDEIEVFEKKNKKIATEVNDFLKLYAAISVTEAMESLSIVGDLLKLSNAASDGLPCSGPIIDILSDYQSLIATSLNACICFADQSKESVNHYYTALKFAEKDTLKAMGVLGLTAKKAQQMSNQSKILIDLSTQLVNKSTVALGKAVIGKSSVVEQLKEAQKRENDIEGQVSVLKTEIDELKKQVDEFNRLIKKEKASRNGGAAFVFQIISSITTPIVQMASPIIKNATGVDIVEEVSNFIELVLDPTKKETKSDTGFLKENKMNLEKQTQEKELELKKKEEEIENLNSQPFSEKNKQLKENLLKEINEIKQQLERNKKSLEGTMKDISIQAEKRKSATIDKEATYIKLKSEYQDLKRNSDIALAQNIHQLKSLSVENDSLEVSYKTLEIIVRTLGRIRTAFVNANLFWTEVQERCNYFSDLGMMEMLAGWSESDDEIKNQFILLIKSTGIRWLAFAKINNQAFKEIKKVHTKFGNIMSNLPKKSEVKEIIGVTCDQLESILTQDVPQRIENKTGKEAK